MRESAIEKYLVDQVKALGGEVRKVKWIGRTGAPDRLVLLPERVVPARDGKLRPGAICTPVPWHFPARHALVELKAPSKKPTRRQIEEHKALRAGGFEVHVIDTLDAVDCFLDEMREPHA